MDGLQIQVLGRPHIALHGVPLAFSRRSASALLIYLAITERLHAREAMAALIASDVSDPQAKKALRSALNDLRHYVGDYLDVTRDTISFNRERPYWLDVQEFRYLLRDQGPATSTESLERAVEIYGADLLTGFSLQGAPVFEDWRERERRDLRAQLVGALLLLLERYGERDDDAGGIACARRLLAIEPWREEIQRHLMHLLSRTGQRRAALAQYEICRHLLAETLGTEPQTETTALYQRLRASETSLPTNVSTTATPLIGRERDLGWLLRQLADPSCRLITIQGLGGSGKSCLALHTARHLVESRAGAFADGVFRVEMAGLGAGKNDPAEKVARDMATALGHVLGLHFRGADPVQQILGPLRSKAALLLLDNVECHPAGRELFVALLQQVPGLKLLVTSRERLDVPEEWVLELEGLELPDGPDDLERAAASRLFLEHARTFQSGVLSPDDRMHVAHICRLVQGLPLALILAASWLRALSCATIAQVLSRGADLLTFERQDLPERQRSMGIVFKYAWQQLTAAEQITLARLTVFRGGFTRDAALQVAEAGTAHLLALRDRALLGYTEDRRYAIPGVLRHFAAKYLAARPDDAARARARHAAYYAETVWRHGAALRTTPDARLLMGADLENIREAWSYASDAGAADLLGQLREGLAIWYDMNGLYAEWSELVGRAVARLRALPSRDTPADPALHEIVGYLLVDGAGALIQQGQPAGALSLLDEAVAASGRTHPEAYSIFHRGQALYLQGHAQVAQQHMEQALAIAQSLATPELEAGCLRWLGVLALDCGEYTRAEGYFERAQSLHRRHGDRIHEGWTEVRLGIAEYEQGRIKASAALLTDGLRIFREFQYRAGEPLALTYLGLVAEESPDTNHEAGTTFVQALSAARALGLHVDEGRALAHLGRHAMHGGDFARARAALEQAERTCRAAGDQPGVGVAQRELGMLACYLGDYRQARDLGRQALAIAQETGQRRAQRFAFRLIGHALAGLDDLLQAKVAYLRALELDRMLGSAPLAVESTVDLARLAMRGGDERQAISAVAALADTLRETDLEGTEEPVLIILTCYNILNTAGDAAAAGLLARGQNLLVRRAAPLSAKERRRYFESVPAHREILRLCAASDLDSQEHPDAQGSPPHLAAATAGDRGRDDPVRGAPLG